MIIRKSVAGSNAGTLAPGLVANELFISEADQFYAPFNDSLFVNNSQAPNDVDLLITPNGDARLAFPILSGQTIPTTVRFRNFIIENLDGSNTLQINAFRFISKAAEEKITLPPGFI